MARAAAADVTPAARTGRAGNNGHSLRPARGSLIALLAHGLDSYGQVGTRGGAREYPTARGSIRNVPYVRFLETCGNCCLPAVQELGLPPSRAARRVRPIVTA